MPQNDPPVRSYRFGDIKYPVTNGWNLDDDPSVAGYFETMKGLLGIDVHTRKYVPDVNQTNVMIQEIRELKGRKLPGFFIYDFNLDKEDIPGLPDNPVKEWGQMKQRKRLIILQ